jgi:hypothetical protein
MASTASDTVGDMLDGLCRIQVFSITVGHVLFSAMYHGVLAMGGVFYCVSGL